MKQSTLKCSRMFTFTCHTYFENENPLTRVAWHNESIIDVKTEIFTHQPRVSLARFTFCWWRHNRLAITPQWPDDCDANTWQMIYNSFDIDFIHGDIHGRSCKNVSYTVEIHEAIKIIPNVFQTYTCIFQYSVKIECCRYYTAGLNP